VQTEADPPLPAVRSIAVAKTVGDSSGGQLASHEPPHLLVGKNASGNQGVDLAFGDLHVHDYLGCPLHTLCTQPAGNGVQRRELSAINVTPVGY
jgi:hypothetical protein